MDRIGPSFGCCVQQRLLIEIALAGDRGSHVSGLVGAANVFRCFVGVAVHGDRLDSKFLRCLYHADCYFASIRDEYFVNHLLENPHYNDS